MATLNAKKTSATKKIVVHGSSPLQAKSNKMTTTFEGAQALATKAKTELFLACVSGFAGEKTFYADDRSQRIIDLTYKVTKKDPQWVENFAAWLRGPDANIRTASLLVAAEYVRSGGPNGRKVIASVCQRADEPAELLAYWIGSQEARANKTPKIPQAIRKGLGDAVRTLYTEYSVLKYFGGNNSVSMRDVLNLVHPKPIDDAQAALFQYIQDRAYGNETQLENLSLVSNNALFNSFSSEEVKKQLNAGTFNKEFFNKSGVTWEQVGSKMAGGWTPEAWGAMIPNMGYMALLRNLRNFEETGISSADKKIVQNRLSDPVQVAKSRQLPFRFISASKNVRSGAYKDAIETALDLSVQNVPEFPGKTLILIDTSGSMGSPVGGDYSTNATTCAEAAAIFGAAVALRNPSADVVAWAHSSKKVSIPRGSSVVTAVEKIVRTDVGHSTNLDAAINSHFNGHDRVIIFSDLQVQHYVKAHPEVPIMHMFDLRGYGKVGVDMHQPGRFLFGGLTDATFKLMLQVEQGVNASWPWES